MPRDYGRPHSISCQLTRYKRCDDLSDGVACDVGRASIVEMRKQDLRSCVGFILSILQLLLYLIGLMISIASICSNVIIMSLLELETETTLFSPLICHRFKLLNNELYFLLLYGEGRLACTGYRLLAWPRAVSCATSPIAL